ncbi:casein kinase II regulatory subunit-domain-containing protein [Lipomyces japonicus]|uniref:casein kinase II regulatory subunit-domain-containing protein n=1 Tax=Lipomyces japonicus TaxID=56871 RepID=UPI0034CF780F
MEQGDSTSRGHSRMEGVEYEFRDLTSQRDKNVAGNHEQADRGQDTALDSVPVAQEDEDSYYESGSSHSEMDTWISSFCSIKGHEFFAEVSEEFIEDDFNLTGLSSLVPHYREALDMILDYDPDPDDASRLPNMPIIENSAELLYGLVHARFLLSRSGLAVMAEKFDLQHFGACPRYLCNRQPVLPVGTSDLPGHDTIKLYCPSCADIYTPTGKEESEIDGAFFGTSFAGAFLKTYTELPNPYGDFKVVKFEDKLTAATAAVAQNRLDKSPTGHDHLDADRVFDKDDGNNSSDDDPASNSATAATTTATQTTSDSESVGWETFQLHLFGFKVSERARSGPRMTWLRERPASGHELEV